MRRRAAGIGLACSLVLAACGNDSTPTPRPACPTEAPTEIGAQATLEDATLATVSIGGAVDGEFEFELYGDEAPIATASFVALARCGFYDGIKFHRVLAGFVIQAGDPATADNEGDFEGIGGGGPGYQFEIEPPTDGLAYDAYSVSMANDTQANGSQFFIALSDLDDGLPRQYTIFGAVVNGLAVIDAIAAVPVTDPSLGVPATPVIIESITISAGTGPQASPGE